VKFIRGLLAAGFVCALLAAPAGAVTTTIGQVSPPVSGSFCVSCSTFQYATATGDVSYRVPAAPAGGGWTLTSWSARASGTADGTARLQVWRPTANAGEFSLLVETPTTAIPANTADPNPVSIPVQPGDVLGLRNGSEGYVPNTYVSPVGNDVFDAIGFPVTGDTAGAAGSTITGGIENNARVNVAATLAAPDLPAVTTPPPPPKKKKCKKKKHRASSAKKKCKKKKGGSR
jgi:hypothetical protein